MSLYKEWTDMVIDYVKHKGEAAFWKEYGEMEKNIYSIILANHNEVFKGKIEDLAEQFDTPINFFMGFLDGINDSLVNPYDIENLEADSEIELNLNLETLYFNMLDAKADYLYSLSQWDGIFSPEKRKEITKEWRNSKTIVREDKVGRNDACPCGSGKKYKKCCGKNA
ncbi:SEC-C metal-binding domain-containing protein [Clostridium sp. MB40-C1]|uniref:SEC-C metal-binding domain-containing protein n=1 Tax=Clostridium sp. MB40-C1 TaxID=3070996 RepID=UPI0027DFBDC8|nr:SEC-C metal-binding domain-containing protein [Clostridium sp. MB40-C1]WMJ80150.1 SEC-C metal-binding domain-containing protein [Clostridium sp. MB40-C1]